MYNILTYISALSVLIPISTLFYKSKALDNSLRVFIIFIAASALADLIGFYCASNNINSVLLFEIYTIVEGVILLVLYSYIVRQYIKSWILFLFIPMFVILGVISKVMNWGEGVMNAAECLVLLLFSTMYFFDVVFMRFRFIQKNLHYFFIINAAIFLYFGINFFLFFFEDSIRYSSPLIRNISWSIHLITHVTFNIIVSIGIARKS